MVEEVELVEDFEVVDVMDIVEVVDVMDEVEVVKVVDVVHLECVAEGLRVPSEDLVQFLLSDVGGVGGDYIEQAHFHSLSGCLCPVPGNFLLNILGQLGFKVAITEWLS